MNGWRGRAGLACATLAIAFADPAAAQQRGGSATYATSAVVGTLDPHVSGSLADLEPIHHIHETLIAMDERHNARPMLAASVTVGDQARRYRFVLRRGVRFHNGEVMSSADVLASFERYAQVSPNAAMLEDVAGYDVPDASTFVVRLKSTNAMFLEMLKTPTYPLAILPADQKDRAAHEVEPVGTGPFRLESWEKDHHLVLRRNDTYAADRSAAGPDGLAGRKTVWLDSLRVNFVLEASDRIAALQDGQADAVANLQPESLRRLADDDTIVVQRVFPFCQLVFVTHSGHGPTAQVLVRQAIRAVVNVEDIIAAAGQPARRNPSLTYPGSLYHTEETAAPFYDRRDPEAARALLRQAGYQGEKIVLQTNSTFSYMRDAILLLAGQMREAGMNPEVQVVDWLTNSANLRRGTGNWNVTSTVFCTQPLLGPQQWRRQIAAYPHIRDRTGLEAAYGRMFAALEFAPRQAAWQQIETELLDQAHFVKVADIAASRAHRARMQGMAPYFFRRFWNTWVN
jgi:peptide/nickel transport system substrate-binding protein